MKRWKTYSQAQNHKRGCTKSEKEETDGHKQVNTHAKTTRWLKQLIANVASLSLFLLFFSKMSRIIKTKFIRFFLTNIK